MRDGLLVKNRELLYLCVYTCEVDFANSDLVFKDACDTCSKELNLFSCKAT